LNAVCKHFQHNKAFWNNPSVLCLSPEGNSPDERTWPGIETLSFI
jgi:hypothetical protein